VKYVLCNGEFDYRAIFLRPVNKKLAHDPKRISSFYDFFDTCHKRTFHIERNAQQPDRFHNLGNQSPFDFGNAPRDPLDLIGFEQMGLGPFWIHLHRGLQMVLDIGGI